MRDALDADRDDDHLGTLSAGLRLSDLSNCGDDERLQSRWFLRLDTERVRHQLGCLCSRDD